MDAADRIACFILFLLLCTVGLPVLIAGVFESEKKRAANEKRKAAERDKLIKKLEGERAALAQERQNVLDAAKQEAEEICATARASATQIFKPTTSGDNFEAIDHGLQKLTLSGLVSDNFITVKYLASPTGRFALEWVVHDPLQSDRIAIWRNDDLFRREGTTANHAGDHLPRGKRHLFVFQLFRNGRMQSELEFEIKIPTKREWLRTVGGMGKKEPLSSQRFRERLSRLSNLREIQLKGYEMVDLMGMSPEEAAEWKADIDAMIARERGEGHTGST